MHRYSSISPVRSLTCFHHADNPANYSLYVACDADILVYHVSNEVSSFICRLFVFDFHAVNGLRTASANTRDIESNSRSHFLMAYGDKALAIYHSNDDGTCNGKDPTLALGLYNLDDRVLDCQILPLANKLPHLYTLMIGYCHNFIDIMVMDVKNGECTMMMRAMGPDRCVLFSLSICDTSNNDYHTDAEDGNGSESVENTPSTIDIVSGNMFGSITLWSVSLHSIASDLLPISHGTKKAAVISPAPAKVTLEGHEGVIFGLRRSKSGKYLASVCDDRSMRLWDIQKNMTHPTANKNEGSTGSDKDGSEKQLFVAWGHTSRVWAVSFIEEVEAPTLEAGSGQRRVCLATGGEDGTIKVWEVLGLPSLSSPPPSSGTTTTPTYTYTGTCLATLAGHAGDVWAVQYSAPLGLVFSGANDGSVKSWNLTEQLKGSAEDGKSGGREVVMPRPEDEKEREGEGGWNASNIEDMDSSTGTNERGGKSDGKGKIKNLSKRRNGVSSLTLSHDGASAIIVLCSGIVWKVQFNAKSSNDEKVEQGATRESEGAVGEEWHCVEDLGKAVSASHVFYFDGDESDDDCEYIGVACAHPVPHADMTVLLLCQDYGNTSIAYYAQCKPHRFQAAYVFIFPSFFDNKMGDYRFTLFSSAAKGDFKVWEVATSFAASTCNREGINLKYSLKRGGRGEMPSAACMLGKKYKETKRLVVGDIKGNLAIYSLPFVRNAGNMQVSDFGTAGNDGNGDDDDDDDDDDDGAILPSQYLHKLHSGDPITCLEGFQGGFCSGGSDASICYFEQSSSSASANDKTTNNDGSNENASSIYYTFIGRYSSLPIRQPEKVTFTAPRGSDIDLNQAGNCFVSGFTGDTFIIYDLYEGYQLMKVEAGSWRRAHSFRVSDVHPNSYSQADGSNLPHGRVSFICAAPLGNTDTVLQLHQCYGGHGLARADKPGQALSALAVSGNGRISYGCVMFGGVEGGCFALGGLDGKIKVYQGTARFHRDDEKGASTESGIPLLLQEVTLPRNAVVKCMTATSIRDGEGEEQEGIVVAAGSRLAYAVWVYTSASLTPLGIPFLPLHLAHSGSLSAQATQDHRILSVSCYKLHTVSVATTETHLEGEEGEAEQVEKGYGVILCDSRGIVTHTIASSAPRTPLGAVSASKLTQEVYTLRSFYASETENPVLSSDAVVIDRLVLGVFGTSSGSLSVYVLSNEGHTSQDGDGDDSSKGGAIKLLEFYAHTVGTNCISATALPTSSSMTYQLIIVSGGDDASVALTTFLVSVQPKSGKGEKDGDDPTGMNICSQVHHCRIDSAAGSALKGCQVLYQRKTGAEGEEGAEEGNKEVRVLTLGADQRLQAWTVMAPFLELPTRTSNDKSTGNDGSRVVSTRLSSPFAADEGSEDIITHISGIVANVGDPQGLYCREGDVEIQGGKVQVLVCGEGLHCIEIE